MALRRVLLIPVVSLRSVQSDSSYQAMIDLVRSARRMNEQMFFYMVVPDAAKGLFPDEPNQLTVPVKMPIQYFLSEMIGLNPVEIADMFCRWGGKYDIDAVVTDIVHGAWYMGQVVSDFRRKHSVPVFSVDINDMSTMLRMTLDQRLGNLFSYAASYMIGGEGCGEYMRGLYKPLFTPYYVDKFVGRVCECRMGLDMSVFERIKKEEKKHDKMSLFCGMRFNEAKGVRFILDVFRTLYSYGRDINVVSTTGTGEMRGIQQVPDSDRSLFTVLKFSCPREEYLREAAKCHVFLSASNYETYTLHIIEQLALGLVGVLPNCEWVFEQIPKEYPFVYQHRNKDQAYTMIDWIMTHYDEALKLVAPFHEYVRKFCDSDLYARDVFDWIGKKVDAQIVNYRLKEPGFARKGQFRMPFRVFLGDVADALGDSFTMTQVLEGIHSKMKTLSSKQIMTLGAPRIGMPTLHDIRTALESFGWQDTCDGPEPRFVRSDDMFVPSKFWADRIEAARKAADAASEEIEVEEEIEEEYDDDEEADSGDA